eukprot:scaffold36788_cov90-Phaeocystis_antarctica.AAC.6
MKAGITPYGFIFCLSFHVVSSLKEISNNSQLEKIEKCSDAPQCKAYVKSPGYPRPTRAHSSGMPAARRLTSLRPYPRCSRAGAAPSPP